MKEASNFFQQFKDSMIGDLNTCGIARVESFDAASMKCNVTTIPDGDLIVSVPVATLRFGGFFVRAPLSVGDLVVIIFSHREIDSIVHSGQRKSGRMLSIDDAIVIAGIDSFDNPLPATNANDLVIGKQDMSAKIIIGADGRITLDAPAGVTIKGSTGTVNY